MGQDTILVVDDGDSNRLVLASYLESTYRILEAESGPRALEVLTLESVDLVLLDVMMPDMDGYAVCRAIKAVARDGFLPVLLVTALSEQEERNEGLEAGADDFLTKPVHRTELTLRCRAFLDLRRKDALVRRQVDELRRVQALKDELVAMLIHDVRNPLAGIDGYLQLIEMKPADALAVAADASSALHASRVLQGLLADMLEVLLLEEGVLKLAREPASIARLATEAIESLSGAGQWGRVPIRPSLPEGLHAPLDRKLVRRAIENLISNAIKYSPPGRAVEVTARGAQGRVEVDVADRGPGVPDELKAAMFEKFSSVEAKKGEPRRGYGLGLHLVKLVATAHGGSVSVHDREGGGALVRLALPAGT